MQDPEDLAVFRVAGCRGLQGFLSSTRNSVENCRLLWKQLTATREKETHTLLSPQMGTYRLSHGT